MDEYQIGKVIGVFGDKIDVVILDFLEEDDLCMGVPENMCIDLKTDEGPTPILIGQPGIGLISFSITLVIVIWLTGSVFWMLSYFYYDKERVSHEIVRINVPSIQI